MARLISPGVLIQEIDLSNIVPAVATSIAGIVGVADKGPIIGDDDSPTLITNQQQFIDVFGEPDGESNLHYAALQFLEAGNQLYVVRVPGAGATYAGLKIGSALQGDSIPTDGTAEQYVTGILVADRGVASSITHKPGGDWPFEIFAKDPGVEGNNIGIAIINRTDFARYITDILDGDTENFQYSDPPTHVEEFILAVYDGNTNQYVESFTVSRNKNRKDARGRSMYIEDVINLNSNWIVVSDNERSGMTGASVLDATSQPMSTIGTRLASAASDDEIWVYDPNGDSTSIVRILLRGGIDGSTPSAGELISGWEKFRNPEDLDVNMLIEAGSESVPVQNRMINICEQRGDCIAILDAPEAHDTPREVVDWKVRSWNPNSSYAALYWPWVRIYDRFRDTEVWVPPSTFVGFVYARTDFTRDPWHAPAGLTKGKINVLDIKYKARQGERDLLYINNINPIVFFPGEGTAIWGQKTLQTKASALDRVNVRRLFLVLEKAIAKAAKYILWQPNDRFTRKSFVQVVDPFLRDIQARRGIEYFKVVCDTSNNPAEVQDRQELVMDIYIQPTKAVEFITLKFNIMRTGVIASELI